ncbi:hypothetical protein NKDENANG_02772 [Candidatus Entotheonellaceae bacterium PAL068K]
MKRISKSQVTELRLLECQPERSRAILAWLNPTGS